MYRRALIAAASVFLSTQVLAQVQMRPTAAPVVTAENEPWYLDGQPIYHNGQLYYPAGALVFFNANEMVRSGFHLGVPLFTRTTIEPYSIVYVPVGRGLMQPYERPRSGELAGTVGSRTPAFPVEIAPSGTIVPAQAAAPPMLGSPLLLVDETPAAERVAVERTVGTTGTATPQQYVPAHVRIGDRPSGLNAIYIEFDGTRWFSTGTTIEVDPATTTRIGDFHGFPVWRGQEADRIFVATSKSGGLAVPYTRNRTPIGRSGGEGEAGKIW
jgi:hypothetical protein